VDFLDISLHLVQHSVEAI